MIQTAPISKKQMTYDEALLYCRFCTYNGYTDWRIPNSDDLKLISHSSWYEGMVHHPLSVWTIQPVRDE